jgi:hypothetical protein
MLKLLPTPTSPRPVERLDSAAMLARAGERGDCEKTVARLALTVATLEDRIAELSEQLEEATDDRIYWTNRALLAEHARRPASLWAGWYALAAMGWQSAWGWFETGASREGLRP